MSTAGVLLQTHGCNFKELTPSIKVSGLKFCFVPIYNRMHIGVGCKSILIKPMRSNSFPSTNRFVLWKFMGFFVRVSAIYFFDFINSWDQCCRIHWSNFSWKVFDKCLRGSRPYGSVAQCTEFHSDHLNPETHWWVVKEEESCLGPLL